MPKGVYKHKKHSADVRRKISAARMGRKVSTAIREKISKSLHVVGEAHGKAKLTNTQILEIRDVYAKGLASQTELAYVYNVSQGCIWSIITKRTWKHI